MDTVSSTQQEARNAKVSGTRSDSEGCGDLMNGQKRAMIQRKLLHNDLHPQPKDTQREREEGARGGALF